MTDAGWIETSVASLIAEGVLLVEDGNHGEYRPRPEEFVAEGIPFIRAADLGRDGVDFIGAGKINGVAFDRIRKGVGMPNDVLLSHKGTVGKVSLAPSNSPEFVCSPQTTFWRSLDFDRLDYRFLRYSLESPHFVSQISAISSESDMAPYVSLTQQKKLTLRLTPVDDQCAIADVLGALDDKIAANRKLVEQLRTIAHAEFTLSTKENSVVVTLSDLAVFHNRRRAPLSAIERESMIGKVPYYGATGVFDYVDRALFDEILLLVGEDGSVATEDGHPVTQYIWGPAWVNNHAHVLTGASISTELLTLAVERASIVSLVTGAVQPKVSMGNLKKLELLFPDQGEYERLNGKIQPIFGLIRSLTEESRTLADTRDALLPGLMSGEVRVRDAEISVEQGL